MEVKEGYKQTEVGVIPEDWNVAEFGTLVNHTKGYAFKPSEYVEDGTRIIRVSDTTYYSIKDDNAIYLDSRDAHTYRKWMLFEYDLIISTVGSKPPMYDSLVGKALIITKDHAGSLLNQNAVVVRNKEKKAHKQILLLNYLRTQRYLRYIEMVFRGNANQASITLEDLFSYLIPFPGKSLEQAAIATALSDADALIQSMEKLIAKKQAIKHAAMQELLKSKKDWECRQLGDISDICTGNKNNEDKVETGLYPFFVRSQKIERINSFSYDGEAILVPGEGNIGGGVHYIKGKFDYHQRVYKISNFDTKYHGKYVYYYMLLHFSSQALKNSVKATVESLRLPAFQEYVVWFPKLKSEQIGIANTLSDMDAEITALEAKLAKYHRIKQGMMQNLLTGKVRLV